MELDRSADDDEEKQKISEADEKNSPFNPALREKTGGDVRGDTPHEIIQWGGCSPAVEATLATDDLDTGVLESETTVLGFVFKAAEVAGA